MKKVGVLALQGDFEAHQRSLRRAGAEAVQVRTPGELSEVQGLVIPGGESTTMLRLLHAANLVQHLKEFAGVKPIYGTCAGAILLAAGVINPEQESLQLMDIDIQRNGYGRQLDSRVARIPMDSGDLEAVFIRAPIIRRVGKDAKVLARYNGDPVLVEQGRHMVSTFHPELTGDTRVHEMFLSKVRSDNGFPQE
jgi:pyridoxal 5'-phosphate synthase pdxT subunit